MTKKHDSEKELKQKIEELEESRKRIAAEFANYRRRVETQKSESIEFAKAEFMAKIAPTLDNFKRAFEHISEKDDTAVISGLRQIEKQLEDILSSEGLERIDTSDIFDPNFHEAISHEKNEEIPADHIIAEIESGWKFKDRVIKPAKVRVSKGK